MEISLAYGTRRADSIQSANQILLKAESKFPREAIIKYNLACYCCQLGEIENAKHYLKKAFDIDLTWRVRALDDEDLDAYGIRFNLAPLSGADEANAVSRTGIGSLQKSY